MSQCLLVALERLKPAVTCNIGDRACNRCMQPLHAAVARTPWALALALTRRQQAAGSGAKSTG